MAHSLTQKISIMRDFKKLEIWRRSHKLALYVYRVTKEFPKAELFGLTSQIRRAASSVPINIAEGCGRYSPKELARFLVISSGSLSEVEYISMLSFELTYLSETYFRKIDKEVNEIKKMIHAYHKSLV